MFHAWDARTVSLATRLLQYPRSCQGAIIGDTLECDASFFHHFRGKYFHPGFYLWDSDPSFQELDRDALNAAEERKLLQLMTQLKLCPKSSTKAIHLLDISYESFGGASCFFALKHPELHMTVIVSSIDEQHKAMSLAQYYQVDLKIVRCEHFDELVTYLQEHVETFDRILSINFISQLFSKVEVEAFVSLLSSVLKPNEDEEEDPNRVVLEFIGSTRNTIVSTQLWTTRYIQNRTHRNPFILSYACLNELMTASGSWQDLSSPPRSYAQAGQWTFRVWNVFFQRQYRPEVMTGSNTKIKSRMSLPESFHRTWEFYLLHSAACCEVRTIQPYQVILTRKQEGQVRRP